MSGAMAIPASAAAGRVVDLDISWLVPADSSVGRVCALQLAAFGCGRQLRFEGAAGL
jgi:hypothetical protein